MAITIKYPKPKDTKYLVIKKFFKRARPVTTGLVYLALFPHRVEFLNINLEREPQNSQVSFNKIYTHFFSI